MHYNADHLFLSEEEMKDLLNPVWYTSPDGYLARVGYGGVRHGTFYLQDFRSRNMCKRDQLITCGKEEMFRLQEDLALDTHEEDVVSQSENHKIVEEFARMIMELIEKAG